MAASYREYASPTGLEDVVGCLWENDRVRTKPQLVVPDGCVDLVWFGSEGLKVVGADTGPHVVQPLVVDGRHPAAARRRGCGARHPRLGGAGPAGRPVARLGDGDQV